MTCTVPTPFFPPKLPWICPFCPNIFDSVQDNHFHNFAYEGREGNESYFFDFHWMVGLGQANSCFNFIYVRPRPFSETIINMGVDWVF